MLMWMVWAVFVSGAMGLAALLAERVLRSRGRPGRFAWAGALLASMTLGAWALAAPAPSPTAPADAIPVGPTVVDATSAPERSWRLPPALRRADPFLRAGWLASSALLGLALLGGMARLGSRARRWPIRRVGDDEVLVSEDFGPALLGLRAPRVVVPRWAMELEGARLRLVVLHEEEHRTAGDAPLLLAGTLAAICAPWNPALWWQLRRLRGAVEVDCDARVVGRGADPQEYGSLLLDVGSRVSGLPLPVAALTKPPSLLERRLTMIVRGAKPEGTLKTALAVAAVAVLTVVACETPPPTAVPVPTEADEGPPQLVSERAAKADVLVRQVVPGVSGVGEARPLVYVDGVRVSAVPADLDPEAIDRIEVIKGEAARAVFGAEAVDGVIQIFTKGAPELTAVFEAKEVPFGPSKVKPVGDRPDSMRLDDVDKANLRILVDGKPFNGRLESIDKRTIDRIEIVKGADGEPDTMYITLRSGGA